jgi:hypothetical protein
MECETISTRGLGPDPGGGLQIEPHRLPIGRQMGVGDDAAGADDDNHVERRTPIAPASVVCLSIGGGGALKRLKLPDGYANPLAH